MAKLSQSASGASNHPGVLRSRSATTTVATTEAMRMAAATLFEQTEVRAHAQQSTVMSVMPTPARAPAVNHAHPVVM